MDDVEYMSNDIMLTYEAAVIGINNISHLWKMVLLSSNRGISNINNGVRDDTSL